MRLYHALLAALCLVASACNTPQALPVTNESVTLIINFEASDEGLAEFSGIMDGVSSAMLTEPGFVSAKVYRNAETPNRFVLVEVWASQALHQEHFDRINQSGDWAHINSLLSSTPVMGYYRPDGE